jgi:NADH-quinone oxidoreductase subunit J
MSTILFFIAAAGAIAGAVGVVVLRDPFYSVLALVGHLLSLAVLFLLLRAEFVAAVQVVVYAGAVMVLYVFVVAYVGDSGSPLGERLPVPRYGVHPGVSGPAGRAGLPVPRHGGVRLGSAVLGVGLLIELFIALLGSGLKAIDGYGAPYSPGPRTYGTPAYIGNLLLTRFLVVFEVASFLLLIAAVGAVVLARRRGGLGEERELLAPLGLARPRGTGTMAEGVGSLAFATAHDRPTDFQIPRDGELESDRRADTGPAGEPATVGADGPPAGTERLGSRGGGW